MSGKHKQQLRVLRVPRVDGAHDFSLLGVTRLSPPSKPLHLKIEGTDGENVYVATGEHREIWPWAPPDTRHLLPPRLRSSSWVLSSFSHQRREPRLDTETRPTCTRKPSRRARLDLAFLPAPTVLRSYPSLLGSSEG